MEKLHTENHKADYTLSFLRNDEAPFSSVMADFIKKHYADLLEPEDLDLIESGQGGLEKIAAKCMERYKASLARNNQ